MNNDCIQQEMNKLRRAPSDGNEKSLYSQGLYDRQFAELKCRNKNSEITEVIKESMQNISKHLTLRNILIVLLLIFISLGLYYVFSNKTENQIEMNLKPQPVDNTINIPSVLMNKSDLPN